MEKLKLIYENLDSSFLIRIPHSAFYNRRKNAFF
jgi:hypothetical protein